MKYSLPQLPFGYNALEPYIDTRTMRIHYEGHHKTYVDTLNELLEPHPKFQIPVDELLSCWETLPKTIRIPVKNNAGGHANHTLFWSLLAPHHEITLPPSIAKALIDNFESFTQFRMRFQDQAMQHFSNGWAWLTMSKAGKMEIFATADHDTPVSEGRSPLLVLDLWEHAYYLKHQNRRDEYLSAFWNIINWNEVAERWEDITHTGISRREWSPRDVNRLLRVTGT